MRVSSRYVVSWVIMLLFLSSEFYIAIIYADDPFKPNTRVNDLVSIPSLASQSESCTAVDDAGNIYITYTDNRNENYDIYFTKSTDGGNTFSTNEKVNDDIGDALQYLPSIAVDGVQNIYVAWFDQRDGPEGDIYFANSTDGGLSFSVNKKVNDDGLKVGQESPSLVVDDAGFIYIVWVDERNRNPDIYFAKSTDGGNTFSTNKKVNDDTGNTVGQRSPSVAVDEGGNIFIVWMDERNPLNPDIYFAKSTDGGNTFSTNKKINDDSGIVAQIEPCIVSFGINKFYIVWTDLRNGDFDIYFTKSIDGGNIFLPNKKVNDDVGNAEQDKPSIAVESPSIIYISWTDNRSGNADIYFAKSTNGGNTYEPNKKINDDAGVTAQIESSMIIDNSGSIYISWTDNRNGNFNIYFTKSTDSGNTFSANKRIDDDILADAGQFGPSIVVDGLGNIYIAWWDDRNGDTDIYFTSSNDGGTSFAVDQKISDDISGAYQITPSMTVDAAGYIYAVWMDERNNHPDIYFAKSTDGGNTFSVNKKVNDDPGNEMQFTPSIAVDSSSNIYIVWKDKRNGENDIYFSKSIDGGNSFSVNKKINDDVGIEVQMDPVIAIDGSDNIYIAWTDERNGDSDIYFTGSADGGNTFSVNKKVNDDTVNATQGKPQMAIDSADNIFIAWEDRRNGHPDIYFARSSDQGSTFSVNNKVNDDVGHSEQLAPAIEAYGFGYIQIAWRDKRNGDSDIYFANSTNGGNSFSQNKRVNDDVGVTHQIAPSLASDGSGNVYAAWEDKRSGRSDVFFSMTELNPTLMITEIQDSPDANEWIEVYNPAPIPINLLDMKISLDHGMTFIDGSWSKSVIDLGEHSVWTPTVTGVLNDEGAAISIHNFSDPAKPVLGEVGYGQYGTTPDPLISGSSARYWDNALSIYEDYWSRNGSTGPTPGAVNNAPGANQVPSVILNEVYFNPFSLQDVFIELIYQGNSSINISDYMIVCDSEYIVPAGTILDFNQSYFYIFYNMDQPLFNNMDSAGDNVYLYDKNGILQDMVGWDSQHQTGKTISRVPDGNGTYDGFNDVSSIAAGWQFNCSPTAQLVKIVTPNNKRPRNFGHFGSYLVLNMTVYNFQIIDDIIDIFNYSQEGWKIEIFDETGTTVIEKITVKAGSFANFTVNVILPSSIPFAVMDNITIEIRSSNSPIVGDRIVLNVRVYPFLNLTKNADPKQIYLNGTGHDEITTITLNLTGMGTHTVRDYLDLVFCIDSSQSMWNNDFGDLRKKESQNFIDNHFESHDRAAVVDFDNVATLQPYGWPIGDHLSSDFEKIKANLEMIDSYPPFKFVSVGLNMSNEELRLYGQPSDHIPIIILITDAVLGDVNAVISEANISASRGVKIFTIGLMTGGTPHEQVLKDVAKITGGLYFEAPDASYFKYIFENISAYLDMAVWDGDTADSNPLVRDVLPWYIDYVPGTFSIQPDNIYKDVMTGDTVIEWNLPWMKLGDTWSVFFNIKANLPGNLETNVYNKSRAFYTRWDNTTAKVLFPRCKVDVLQFEPFPPKLHIDMMDPNKNDIHLWWEESVSYGTDHFLIYKAKTPTDFNFSDIWVNTSQHDDNGIIKLRTSWNHTGAADPFDAQWAEQYYYCIRAVNNQGGISRSSRTVGKWTKEFSVGVSTFSLPLEPFVVRDTEYYTQDMDAEFIKWMNGTKDWVQHDKGEAGDNTNVLLGKGYMVNFLSSKRYTFFGMPGAMIRYKTGGFRGFDQDIEAKSLSASVDPISGSVTLTWDQPQSMNSDDFYKVYYSLQRDGFDGIEGSDYFSLPSPYDIIPFTGTREAIHDGAIMLYNELYYMVIPVNESDVEGSSTYSIGVWTSNFSSEYDTFGIPLKLDINQTADWYCDNIPDTVGINYFVNNKQRWNWHSTRMSAGAFDPNLVMGEGYQISTSSATKFVFIGR